MQPLPHVYSVSATGSAQGSVTLATDGLPSLASAPPAQFDGPGDQWSPESLLTAAVASCFILTFRAIARSSRLPWTQLVCSVAATLDRVERTTQFTRLVTRATLTVPAGTSTELCERVLTKSEEGCLIANSLRGERELQMEIVKALARESEGEAACAG